MVGTTEALFLASFLEQGVPASGQLVVLAGYKPPATRATVSSQLELTVATEGRGVPASTGTYMLYAYRTGTIENLKARSWGFTLDNHPFYVLTVGEQGTLVYDMYTKRWTRWQTAGLSCWNMERGTTWRGDVIAADQANPVIWRLDPTRFIDDDYKPQTRVATGGFAVRQRAAIPQYSFSLSASMSNFSLPNTAPPTYPTVTLAYSDDQGLTFRNHGTITLTTPDKVEKLLWKSLGEITTPGRLFRITDTGAIARIDGADADVGPEGT